MLLMHFEQLVIWTLVSQGDTQGMIFMVLYMVFSHLFLFLEYKPNPKKIHSMNCIGDNYLVESLLSSHPKLVLSSIFVYICHSYSVPLLLFSWNCSYMIRDSEIHPLLTNDWEKNWQNWLKSSGSVLLCLHPLVLRIVVALANTEQYELW